VCAACGSVEGTRPEPPKLTTWTIYKIAPRQERLGIIEAPAPPRSRRQPRNSARLPTD
jgi:hypothetical protein